MKLPSFINFSSKTFWLSAAMIFAGFYKMAGIDIPGLPDLEFINSFAPEDAETLIKLGFMGVFVRDAIGTK